MGPCCIRKVDNIGCMIKNSSNRPEKVIFSHVKPIWLFVGKNFRLIFFLRHFGVDLSTVYDSTRIFVSDTLGHSTRRFGLFFVEFRLSLRYVLIIKKCAVSFHINLSSIYFPTMLFSSYYAYLQPLGPWSWFTRVHFKLCYPELQWIIFP